MVSIALRYAFIDEAGSVALSRKNHTFVMAAICLENPRVLENLVNRARKKYGTSLASGELKAKKSEDKLTSHLLTALAKEQVEIFSIVVNRQILETPLEDSEEIYRWVMTRLVRKLVARYPQIEITLDRRYTKESLRYKLEKAIREGISDIPQQYVLIRQEDSQPDRGIQAMDFIAWALFQKYEHNNDAYHQIIAPCIVEEEFISKQTWDVEWK